MAAYALRAFLRSDGLGFVDPGDRVEGASEAYAKELVRVGLAELRGPAPQPPLETKVIKQAPSTKAPRKTK